MAIFHCRLPALRTLPAEVPGCDNGERGAILEGGNVRAGGVDRVQEILAGLIAQAEACSRSRCPYRNRHDECTAAFNCSNRRKTAETGPLPLCSGDGRLNHQRA